MAQREILGQADRKCAAKGLKDSSPFSPTQARRAVMHLHPQHVLALRRGLNGRLRSAHWALTTPRPSANVTLSSLRVANLAARLFNSLVVRPRPVSCE